MKVEAAMTMLTAAHAEVGGEVASGGGTGTWDLNCWITELQAGSYTLMDTHYEVAGVGFAKALSLQLTIVSRNVAAGWAVADGGLIPRHGSGRPAHRRGDGVVLLRTSTSRSRCARGAALAAIGAHVRVWPAHVDPTVGYHERLWVVRDGQVVDQWPVDRRGW